MKEITDERRAELLAKPPTRAINMVLQPQTFEQLIQFAQMASKSSMVPPQYKGKPEDIMLAVQMGSELGLAPMQSLQNVATINGRPSVYGDALIGLCRQSPHCKDIEEGVDGEGDKMVAWCKATRTGAAPVMRSFSVEDAKKAGLWGKSGPWQQYPKRMLQMRARGFAVRDAFPDVLRGLISAEEAADIPPDSFKGTTIEARPEAPPPSDPPPRQKQTGAQWLDELDQRLRDAEDREHVDNILAEEKTKRMAAWLTNGAKQKYNVMVTDALARVSPEKFTIENDPTLVPVEQF